MTRFCSVAEQSSTVYPGHVLCICTSAGEYLSWAHNLSVVNSKHGVGGGTTLCCVLALVPAGITPGMAWLDHGIQTACFWLQAWCCKQGRLFRNVIGPQWCDWALPAQKGNWAKSVCSLYGLPSFHTCGGETDKSILFFVGSPPRQKDSIMFMFQGFAACFGEKRFWFLWCTLGRWSPSLHGLHWGEKQALRQQYRTWSERACSGRRHHSVMSFKETLLFDYLNFV